MSLEHAFFLSQIIASIAVVASLIFVGHQVRENTLAIQRNEHNSTMEQWTVIRQAIARNREIAELMSVGLSGERKLDSADELRLDQMLQEVGWDRFTSGIGHSEAYSRREPLRQLGAACFARCFAPRAGANGGASPKPAVFIPPSLPMSKRCSLPMNRRRERPHPSGPLQKARARKR